MDERFAAQLAALREALAPGDELGEWRARLDTWAAAPSPPADLAPVLIELATALARRECERSERWRTLLTALGEGLVGLEQALAIAEQQASASYQGQRKAEVAFERQLQDAESWLRVSSNLESLRQAVHQRLAVLRAQLDDNRAKQATQFTTLQGQLGQLTTKIHRLEEESSGLRAELEQHRVELAHSRADLEQSRADLEQTRVELEQTRTESPVDPLTRLPNRLALDQRLSEELARQSRYGTPFALLEVAVDGHEQLVRRHGEAAGEQALAAVARVLRGALREADFLARDEGPVLAVVLPQAEAAALITVGERLRRLIERFDFPGHGVAAPLTISVGATAVRLQDNPVSAALRARALAGRAVAAGGNRCEVG